jgi:hypothetical protein
MTYSRTETGRFPTPPPGIKIGGTLRFFHIRELSRELSRLKPIEAIREIWGRDTSISGLSGELSPLRGYQEWI